jgi:predicted ATPase
LTGSGGVGKTRLALRVAFELRAEFSDAAHWVNLEPVADEALVTPTIAAALGVREGPGRSTTQALTDWLADRRLLLVLDNCERVAGRVGSLVLILLQAAPHLRLDFGINITVGSGIFVL